MIEEAIGTSQRVSAKDLLPRLNIDITVRDDDQNRLARGSNQGIVHTINALNNILKKLNADVQIKVVKKRKYVRKTP